MRIAYLLLCSIILLIHAHPAWAADLTGVWESKYDFGGAEEVMIANISQAGEDLSGTFLVQPSSGGKYSGVIFGKIYEDTVKAYYLSTIDRAGKDPLVMITFVDGQIADQNTIEGTYYVLTKSYKCLDCGREDIDTNFLYAPYEATRQNKEAKDS
jgi:hypothetical protein